MYPKPHDIAQYFEDYNTVPVFYELLTDSLTPVRIFSALREKYDNCFILESVINSDQWGRYSFIGLAPEQEIRIRNKKDDIISADGSSVTKDASDPIKLFSDILEKHESPKFTKYPKLTGGLMGYFGYDMARYYEKTLVNIPKDDLDMPDADMFLYKEIVAFDHLKSRAVITLNIDLSEVDGLMRAESLNREQAVEKIYAQREERAKEIAQLLMDYVPRAQSRSGGSSEVTSNYTKEEFCKMVEDCKAHIINGDISQVVISQRFEVKNPPDPFDVYRMLRSADPSPYLYFFDHKDYSVAGASPEMLVSVVNGKMLNKPIAGTYPRGRTEEEDESFAEQLRKDPKEVAEHTMLVDLGRNDVGRVCRPGSVKVTDFMRVERYSKLMHLVSDVEGILMADKTPVHALMSVLPAGTLSGAPKVKAMEIIDSLERTKRGLYGGTVGYFAFNGDIDTCIAIRTVLFRNSSAYIQAGAGIVYDSVPEKEYEETRRKAAAVISAIEEASSINNI